MNKIAIVIPYYGKIPEGFSLFLKSLSYNENVLDILFFTDEEIKYDTPPIFYTIKLQWGNLVNRLKTSFGSSVNINTPYKLCDFKPMYGKIFENELKDYTYWGYGDIDLIYGNIKRWLPFNGIEKYDVITFRENVMHGPFSLFKNSDYVNNLYKRTNRLEEIISNPNYIGFDEAGRIKPWRKGIRLYNLVHIDNFWDFSTIIQHEADNGKLKLFERYYALECLHADSILQFKKGVLTIGVEEYAFFHWVYHKTLYSFTIPKWKNVPDQFFVHSTGFYKSNEHFFILKKHIRHFYGRILKLKQRLIDSFNHRILKQ